MMAQSAKRERQRWKMTAQELAAAPVLIPGNEWNPLDGGPAPEYIPPAWDGPHVGLRLIDGFKTLACLPNRNSLTASSGFWPETWVEWEDMLAQVGTDTQEIDAAIRNRIRLRPSAEAISRMEIVLMWPARYLASQSILMARTVQMVAFMRSRDHDLNTVARKMRMGPKHLRRINREGLDIIAAGLRQKSEPVF